MRRRVKLPPHPSSLITHKATWKTLDASWWLRWGWRALRRWCRRWCPHLSEGFRLAASVPGPASRISLRCQCQCSDFRCIQQLLICNRSYWLSDGWWSQPSSVRQSVASRLETSQTVPIILRVLFSVPKSLSLGLKNFVLKKSLILGLDNFGLKKSLNIGLDENMVSSVSGARWPLQLSDCTVLLQISSTRRGGASDAPG